MNDVSASITKLNKQSKLFVLREPAVTLLPKLFKAWKITHLVFEKDTDAYAKERDAEVVEHAKKAGVKIVMKSGRTLWDSDEVVKANGGKPTMSMSQIISAGEKVGEIKRPVDAPTSLPPPGDLNLDIEHQQPETEPDMNSKHRKNDELSYSSGLTGPGGEFSIPTLEELGLEQATTHLRGGESVILSRLNSDMFENEDYIGAFEKPKTSPAAFDPQSTCLTSPYLHFGALSCRYFYYRVLDIVEKRKKAKKPVSEPPTSLTGQLLFRDMYFAAQAALGWNFGQTYNNPRCRFVPWHLPSKVDLSTGLITGEYEIDDESKELEFQRWAKGQTGFPWIDAIMRQLRREGWIHHLARHSVACFLTRGGCYISWERGAEVFEELLIDHEAACNIGNWQWLSCTAFFAQFYRCYSPIAFGKKWDDNGDYIRKYVPELKDMPKKYIYEPHKAPIQDQKNAGVQIKGDGSATEEDGFRLYPKPMFDFNRQREICIQGMKAAFSIGLYGNDPKVLDGTWKTLFDDTRGPTGGNKSGPLGLDTWEVAARVQDSSSPTIAKTNKKKHNSSPAANGAAGSKHKRGYSQETLDNAFKKKSKG